MVRFLTRRTVVALVAAQLLGLAALASAGDRTADEARQSSQGLSNFAERRFLDRAKRLVRVLQHLAGLEQRRVDDVGAGRSRLAFDAAQKVRSQNFERPHVRGGGAAELVQPLERAKTGVLGRSSASAAFPVSRNATR